MSAAAAPLSPDGQSLGQIPFVFVAGVEGTGTTVMSRLLSAPNGCIALGGNYASESFRYHAVRLNKLTAELWAVPRSVQPERRDLLLQQIRELPLPPWVQMAVYKRSYPFQNELHYPELGDVLELHPQARIVVMERPLPQSVRSIQRRGFARATQVATVRVERGHNMLQAQLERLDPQAVLRVPYGQFVSEATKAATIAGLERYLQLPLGTRGAHSDLVTGPSVARP